MAARRALWLVAAAAAGTNASFLPFLANNSAAYLLPGDVSAELKRREQKVVARPDAREILSEAKRNVAKGFSWNAFGVSFPRKWDFASKFQKDVLEPLYLKSGTIPGQSRGGHQTARCLQGVVSLCAAWGGRVPERAVEVSAEIPGCPDPAAGYRAGQRHAAGVLLDHDHRARTKRPRCDAAARRKGTVATGLACDGFARLDWRLSDSFVRRLEREVRADGVLQGKEGAYSSGCVALPSLEDPSSPLLGHADLSNVVRGYLGDDAKLSGYGAIHLTNKLKTAGSYGGRRRTQRAEARVG